MKKGSITIHDITKSLGIDSSTVSRALNDNLRVTKKIKEKILKKAKELGYQRNGLASKIRTNKTNTIGVIVPRISRYFFSRAIAGIEAAAQEIMYTIRGNGNIFVTKVLKEGYYTVKVGDPDLNIMKTRTRLKAIPNNTTSFKFEFNK